MGLFDKVKKILFDEEEVEVPVNDGELPERAPKKAKKEESRGFIDYGSREEENVVEEDPIVEVKVPKEEVVKSIPKEPKGFNLQEDFEIEEELPTRSRFEETTQEYRIEDNSFKQVDTRIDSRIDRVREPRKDYRELAKVETTTKSNEVKDYKRIVSETKETTFKKPFKVTPIISPVYGILDKNYTADEVLERREQINLVNNGVTKKPRTFSSVGYSDMPLPKGNGTSSKMAKELVELNSTINEMIDDAKLDETREIAITRTEIKVSEPAVEERTVVQEVKKPVVIKEEPIEDTEEIIMTPNYDDFETSSIENQYIGNNNIEDAFENTNEFNRISEFDKKEEIHEEAPISIEEIINNRDNIEEEDHLEDTIETDLFNLIDSMYKRDDDDEEDSED